MDAETIETLKQIISPQFMEKFKEEEAEYIVDQSIQMCILEMQTKNTPINSDTFFKEFANKIQDPEKLYIAIALELINRIKKNYYDFYKTLFAKEEEKNKTGKSDPKLKKFYEDCLKKMDHPQRDITELRKLDSFLQKITKQYQEQKPLPQEKILDPIENFKKTILNLEHLEKKTIIENKELLKKVSIIPKKRKEFESEVVTFTKIPKTSESFNFDKEIEELKLKCINPTKKIYEYIPTHSNERYIMITLDSDSQIMNSNIFKIAEFYKEFNTYKTFHYEGSIKNFIQEYEKKLEFYQNIMKQISYKKSEQFDLDVHLEQTFGQYEVFIFVNILSSIYIPSLVIKVNHDKIETSFQELPCDEKNLIYQKAKKIFGFKQYQSITLVFDSWIQAIEISMK